MKTSNQHYLIGMKNKIISHLKTLIVHPDDRSTDFLKPIYTQLPNTTILITGSYTSSDMNRLIEEHDRVIMLGHGARYGLLSRSAFTNDEYIINTSNVEALRAKENSIFIWCYANEFVCNNNLKGLSTGMFISEPLEATLYEIEATDAEIDASNNLFAQLLGNALARNYAIQDAYHAVFCGYKCPRASNKVITYNAERWSYFI
jgi:hypothetical protein